MVVSHSTEPDTAILLIIVLAVAAVLMLATSIDRRGGPGPGAGSDPSASLLSGPGPRDDAFGFVTLLCISAVAAGILLAVYAWLLSKGYIG